MKKLCRIVLVLVGVALPALSLSAASCWDPCSGGPLCCGHFSAMVKGGVSPSTRGDTGTTWLTNPANDPPVFPSPQKFGFDDYFGVPWNVGAEVAWNASCRIQFFLEYAYTQAAGKSSDRTIAVETTLPGEVCDDFASYQSNAGYLGSRYYFDGCCLPCIGKIVPYLGFKAGFVAQGAVRDTVTVNGTTSSNDDIFKSQTAVSAGLQLGFEWWAWRCITVVLQGDFVGTCGLRSNRRIVFNPPVDGVISANQAGSSWVYAWPVTLGLRYNF
jgi:hypothetical protein